MFRVFFVEKMDETEISKEIALPHFRMFVDTDSMRNTKRQLLCQIKEKLVTNERTNERTNGQTWIYRTLPPTRGIKKITVNVHFIGNNSYSKLHASFKWLQSAIYLPGKPTYKWLFKDVFGYLVDISKILTTKMVEIVIFTKKNYSNGTKKTTT